MLRLEKHTAQYNELIQAVKENNIVPLHLLLKTENKADDILERVRDKDGRSLLHVAAFEGAADALTVLLKSPKFTRKLNSTDRARRTPIHLAAAIGNEPCVRNLSTARASLDPHDEWGCTPLHLAIKFDQVPLAKVLIELGANPCKEDLRGDTVLDLAKTVQDTELHAMLASFEHRKSSSAWKCLTPLWGRRRQRDSLETDAAAVASGDRRQLPASPKTGNLSMAQKLIGETSPSGPVKNVEKSAAGPHSDRQKVGKEVQFSQSAEVHRLDDEDSECASRHTEDCNEWYNDTMGQVPTCAGANVDQTGEVGIVGWHGNEPIYGKVPASVSSKEHQTETPAPSAPFISNFSSIGDWIREQLSGTAATDPPNEATIAPAPQRQAIHFPESDDEEDEEDDESVAGGVDNTVGLNDSKMDATFRVHFVFDASATKLEFEVAWQTQPVDLEPMDPVVGRVDTGGAAARRGVVRGDKIIGCNATLTEGRSRPELIPLLKQRPLLLKVDRVLQLVDRRNPCAEFKVEIVQSGPLGIKLSQGTLIPYVNDVVRGSAAEAAGLIENDALINIRGQRAPQDANSLRELLKERPLSLIIWRLPWGTRTWPEGIHNFDATPLM